MLRKKPSILTKQKPLTDKQWQKLNEGAVIYNMNKSMNWLEFQNMPQDLQQEYIVALKTKYHATIADIAKMLGVAAVTLRKYCAKKYIDTRMFLRGHHMGREDLKNRQVFLQAPVKASSAAKIEASHKTLLSEFSLSFSSPINLESMTGVLESLLENCSAGELHITFRQPSGGAYGE